MGVRRILILFIFFALAQGLTSSSCDAFAEPCFLRNNVEIPYIETRHPDIEPSQETNAEKYCDLFALDPNIWYRSAYNMTTHAVQWQGCGTKRPIWLNGTIPGPTDGTVSLTACVRGLSEECELTYTVQIKNCNYYTVYCFPNVPDGCQQRYCFDIDQAYFTTTEPAPSTHARTTSASGMSSTFSESSTSGKLPENECLHNSLAVFLVTLCACTAVFGVTLATLLYLFRRSCADKEYYSQSMFEKIVYDITTESFPRSKVHVRRSSQVTKKGMNRVEMKVPVKQPCTILESPRRKQRVPLMDSIREGRSVDV